ncbi:hypothetical protein BN439_1599 [Erwinia amylovora Ea644]|nr:hypothetical protein BN439_1599 [Erwinia amylovora Ea644]
MLYLFHADANSCIGSHLKGTSMSKLQREITSNKAQLVNADARKMQRKVLVDSLLDTVSGGWVNAFANWTKRI